MPVLIVLSMSIIIHYRVLYGKLESNSPGLQPYPGNLMIKFYSKAWLDEMARRMETDPRFLADGKKLNGTFVFRVYDGPDGKDRRTQWTFKHGKAIEWKYEEHPSPWQALREEPFSANFVSRTTMTYEKAARLNRGEITVQRALSSPDYKIEGNMSLIMAMMKAFQAWNLIASEIPVEYDFPVENAPEADQPSPTSSTPAT